MFAIVRTGGKQVRVTKGDVVRVEKLSAEEGEDVVFGEVLLVEKQRKVNIGTPTVKGATVKGKVLVQGKDKKMTIRRYKSKKRVRTKQGHRQPYTEIKITEISM